jgi:hypothetical protein
MFESGDRVQDNFGEKGIVLKVDPRRNVATVKVEGAGQQTYLLDDLTLLYKAEELDEDNLEILEED